MRHQTPPVKLCLLPSLLSRPYHSWQKAVVAENYLMFKDVSVPIEIEISLMRCRCVVYSKCI